MAAIHEFETVLAPDRRQAGGARLRLRPPAARSSTAARPQAAAKLQGWANKGYFTPNFNGVGYDPAWQQFAKGKGRFMIAGTWMTADLAKALGDKSASC